MKKSVLFLCILMLANIVGCKTITEYGDNVSYVDASQLDDTGKRAEAFTIYLKIAENSSYSGVASAQYRVAKGYLDGDGVTQNIPKGIEWLEKVAASKDVSWARFANNDLGRIYDVNNEYGIEPDLLKAYEYYSKCAAIGYKLCFPLKEELWNYPVVYISQNETEFKDAGDNIVPFDIEVGYKYFKKAKHKKAYEIFLVHARRGNVGAQENVAIYYKTGTGGTIKNDQKYVAWTYLAAKNGSIQSLNEMAGIYRLGNFLPGSDAIALEWLKLAANQEDAEAVNGIGVIYANPFDVGVEPNYEKSFVMFQKAALLGSVNAVTNMGDSYLEGLGVEKDRQRAKELYVQAANLGNMYAKRKLFEFFDFAYKPEDRLIDEKVGKNQSETVVVQERVVYRDKSISKPKKSLVQLFSELNPSVYKIIAVNSGQIETDKDNAVISQGSAVAITETLALTNCHVLQDMDFFGTLIEDELITFQLALADKKKDLCLIRSTEKLVPIAETRDFSKLKVGERVYAIGSPEGLQNTFSEGIVSGLRVSSGVKNIQTTAPFTHGSSGGGLFDEQGRLIGITTKGYSGSGNLNFAISFEEAISMIEGLK